MTWRGLEWIFTHRAASNRDENPFKVGTCPTEWCREMKWLIGTLLAFASLSGAAVDESQLLYFDPIATVSSNRLKRDFDSFLNSEFQTSGQKAPTFQPVVKLQDFLSYVTTNRPSFLITSSVVLKTHGLDKDYRPIASLVCKDSAQGKLLFLANKSLTKKGQLLLASSHNQAILAELFSPKVGQKVKDCRVIQTKKDIDGILALINGQVDLAVTSESVYSLMAETNREALKELQTIEKSKRMPSPQLFVRQDQAKEETTKLLARALKSMMRKTEGKNVLKSMGCEEWQ